MDWVSQGRWQQNRERPRKSGRKTFKGDLAEMKIIQNPTRQILVYPGYCV